MEKWKYVPIDSVKLNPNNPRVIKDHRFQELVESIKKFPKMMELRPIVVNADGIVLGGNMRLKACQAAGFKKIPVINASDLSEAEQREFVIKDNVAFGDWEWSKIVEDWGEAPEWGLEIPNLYNHELVKTLNESDEWVGMPDFEAKDEYPRIVIKFLNEEDRDKFVSEYKLRFIKKEARTWMTSWPFQERADLKSLRYEQT